MKKISLGLVLLAIVLQTTVASASSIDYRGNQSADYIRTLNRNAALDGADIVLYNPAGTAMLEDGIHVNFGLQFLFKTYEMEMTSNGKNYKSDYPSLFLPNLYGIYKKDNWSAFAGFHIPAGGGTVKYKDGISLFNGSTVNELEAKSIYYGFTAGGAYAVNDIISLSLSGRFIYASREFEGKAVIPGPTLAELDTEQTAKGFGGIIGLNLKPLKELNIGLRYETKTKLELEADTKKNGFSVLGYKQFDDGAKQRRDLPALFGFGIGYDVTEQLKLTAGLTYFFIKQADAGDKDGYDDDYDNGYDAAIGAEFKVIPELLFTVGYMYSDTGANKDTVSDFDMTLDSHNYSTGVKYTVVKDVDLSLGYIYSKYIDLKNATKKVNYKKVVHTVGVGVNAKF